MTEVRNATRDDLPELGRVLGEAFAADPVLSWLFPAPERRVRRLSRVFIALASQVHNGPECVEIAVDGDRVAGAALWDPPGPVRPSSVRVLLAQSTFVRTVGGRFRRQWAVSRAVDAARPREPHWYLAVLGTGPATRGTGAGRRLLDSRLRRCDTEGSPAYLESSNPANVPYYERSGFRLTTEIPVPDGPTLYGMWRPAGG